MKRIILLLLVLITSYTCLYAESDTNINKLADDQVETRFLRGGTPIRYYSNILIQLQGNPTKEDSLIFRELVDTLNALIDKWDVSLIPKGTSNLVVEINMPDRKKEMNKLIGHRDNSREIIKRSVVLNMPPDLDFIARKKVIYYYVFRSLVILNGDQQKAKAVPGSIFTEVNPNKITFHPVDFEIIRKLFSEEYENKLGTISSRQYKTFSNSLLFNLIALLISFSFLIYMSVKGKFTDHHYQFKPFLKQGFLVIVACAFYLGVNKSVSVYAMRESFPILFEIIAGFIIVIFLIICLIFFFERTLLKDSKNFSLQVLIPFFSISIMAIVVLFIFNALMPDKSNGIYLSVTYSLVFYSLIIGFIRSIYIFTRIKSENIIRKKDLELARMSELHKQAELQSLRAKINPHFLYNALNSIASLATTDARKTEQMALALSDFFKYAINREQKQLNTLSEELNAIRTYLEIEKVRFGDRLTFEIDCPPELLDIQIPQLLIQPLVENAIKHGLSQITENGLIGILVCKEENQLKIRVYDNGPDFPEGPLTGFGIQNTQERIALLYGAKATINWQNGAEKYIEISIPDLQKAT